MNVDEYRLTDYISRNSIEIDVWLKSLDETKRVPENVTVPIRIDLDWNRAHDSQVIICQVNVVFLSMIDSFSLSFEYSSDSCIEQER
jgi:hypothetical protein